MSKLKKKNILEINTRCVYSAPQSCSTLCHPMDYSLPDSSVTEIFQARILAWIAISYSMGSSWPRDWAHVSCVTCFSRWILYHSATWEAPNTRCRLAKIYNFRYLHKKVKVQYYRKSIKAFLELCMLMSRRRNFSYRSIDQIKNILEFGVLIPLQLGAVFQTLSFRLPWAWDIVFLLLNHSLLILQHQHQHQHHGFHLNRHVTYYLNHSFVLHCGYFWTITSKSNLILKIFQGRNQILYCLSAPVCLA